MCRPDRSLERFRQRVVITRVQMNVVDRIGCFHDKDLSAATIDPTMPTANTQTKVLKGICESGPVRLGWRFRFLLFRRHNGRSLPLQAAARSNTQSRLGSRSRDIPSASTAQPLQNIRNNVRCCARLVLFHLQTPSIGKTLSPASHRAALPSYSCFISSSMVANDSSL